MDSNKVISKKINTLLWSGCSLSFGSGMVNEWGDLGNRVLENRHDTPDNLTPGEIDNSVPVYWTTEKFKKKFPEIKTQQEAMDFVKELSYPMQVGKNLGIENTYNLSIPGRGVESQLRVVSSFIINNQDKIDFTKCVFCYQIPSLARVELLDVKKDKEWIYYFTEKRDTYRFSTFYNPIKHPKDNTNFIENHFDFDYYIAKYLMYICEYRGFLESKGITFLPYILTEAEDGVGDYFDYEKGDSFMVDNMLNFNDHKWTHEKVKFPTVKKLQKELDIWKVPFSQDDKSFKYWGYYDDGHFSPEGHEMIGKIFSDYLEEKIN